MLHLSDHQTDDYSPDEPGSAYFASNRASHHRLGYDPDDEEQAVDRQLFRHRYGQFKQALAGRSYRELIA